jgi:hypothetical protein
MAFLLAEYMGFPARRFFSLDASRREGRRTEAQSLDIII